MSAIEIRPEQPGDEARLAPVLDAAFGPGRFAKTSERIRERCVRADLSLSRVAVGEGAIVGGCRLSWTRIGAEGALFLGPLAVSPAIQAQGLGRRLVASCLEAAAKTSAFGVLLIGAPSFFSTFGFERAPAGAVILPGPADPARLLWLPLRAGASPAGALSRPPGATPP